MAETNGQQWTSGFPDFIRALELAPVDPPAKAFLARDRILVSFYEASEQLEIPFHVHGEQWGVVITGCVHFEVDGSIWSYHPGDTYHMLSGVRHRAILEPGTSGIDVFAEPDRY